MVNTVSHRAQTALLALLPQARGHFHVTRATVDIFLLVVVRRVQIVRVVPFKQALDQPVVSVAQLVILLMTGGVANKLVTRAPKVSIQAAAARVNAPLAILAYIQIQCQQQHARLARRAHTLLHNINKAAQPAQLATVSRIQDQCDVNRVPRDFFRSHQACHAYHASQVLSLPSLAP